MTTLKDSLLDLSASLTPENKWRRFCIKQRAILLSIPLCLATFYFVYNPTPYRLSLVFFDSSRGHSGHNWSLSSLLEMEDESSVSCHLPQLDPFDPLILPYYETREPKNCTIKYPILFRTDPDPELKGRFNLIKVQDFKKFDYDTCCYQTCWLENVTNVDTKCSDCTEIIKDQTGLEPGVEMVQVNCTNLEKNDTVFIDMFGLVPVKPEVEDRVYKYKSHHSYSKRRRVNVVIFGMDSMSHMNFIRTMPKTHAYLINDLDAPFMGGYVKCGENTFPNMVAALTGQSVADIEKYCWINETTFDDCPFIWKKFVDEGYVTSYGEDSSNGGIFDNHADGFLQVPTDYYFNKVTQKLVNELGHKAPDGEEICYGSRLGMQLCLDYMKQFAWSMATQFEGLVNYFQFIWTMSMSHGGINGAILADDPVHSTLQWFNHEGYLNDTVIVVMSDHGQWSGHSQDTLQGKIERVMPYLYFVLPDWFKLKYGWAVQNMKSNEDKLTTHFDLHQTLHDLVNLDSIEDDNLVKRADQLKPWAGNEAADAHVSFGTSSSNLKWPRGISLFLPIPRDRNCDDAGINENYCVCREMKVIDPGNPLVEEAGLILVQKINEILEEAPECKNLTLDTVLQVRVLMTKNKEIEDMAHMVETNPMNPRLEAQFISFALSVQVEPSAGHFEATVTRGTDMEWRVSDQISRINAYGSQSACVSDTHLKPFCYCADSDEN